MTPAPLNEALSASISSAHHLHGLSPDERQGYSPRRPGCCCHASPEGLVRGARGLSAKRSGKPAWLEEEFEPVLLSLEERRTALHMPTDPHSVSCRPRRHPEAGIGPYGLGRGRCRTPTISDRVGSLPRGRALPESTDPAGRSRRETLIALSGQPAQPGRNSSSGSGADGADFNLDAGAHGRGDRQALQIGALGTRRLGLLHGVHEGTNVVEQRLGR